MTYAEIPPSDNPEEEAKTGLSGLSTWPKVYGAVVIVFLAVVVTMWGFEILYS